MVLQLYSNAIAKYFQMLTKNIYSLAQRNDVSFIVEVFDVILVIITASIKYLQNGHFQP